MTNWHSNLEHLSDAMLRLATEPGRIKERLLAAATRGLAFVDRDSLPEPPRGRFEEIYEELTRYEGPDGSLSASIERLSEARAVEIARVIVDIRAELRSIADAE